MTAAILLLTAGWVVTSVVLGAAVWILWALMTIPGGLPPPRPDQVFADPGAPMAPGAQAGIVRAKQVIVYGPTGAIVGVFVYAPGTTPGPGNPPVDSITRSATDPYLNAVVPDFVAYGTGGAYAQLTDGQLAFQGATGQFLPALVQTQNAAGLLDLQSGKVGSGDTVAEFTLQSATASGVAQAQAIINAAAFIVNATSTFNADVSVDSANLNIGNGSTCNLNFNPKMATPPNQALIAAGTATAAQICAWANGVYTSMKNRGMFN